MSIQIEDLMDDHFSINPYIRHLDSGTLIVENLILYVSPWMS